MTKFEEDMNKFVGYFDPVTFADGTSHIIGAMGNVGVVETDEGLVVFDLATRQFAKRIFTALRQITDKPIKFIIFSHGHFDHCFGFEYILNEIKEKGWEMPKIIAHENVIERFKKYKMLDEYHNWINSMQFASMAPGRKGRYTSTVSFLEPNIILHNNDTHSFELGGYHFDIYHDKGETDDSLWMFFREKKVLFAGDLTINGFPNIGNPYKVQRYPKHWAIAMEKMLELDADFIVPGHGTLIQGKDNVREELSIRAEALNFVHDEVVKRLNQGKWFEDIYHEMLDIYPEHLKNHDVLKPIYGCYQFAIHATYRLYHGWYNSGNPTDLFPAKSSDIAGELLKISEPSNYFEHARRLYETGELQLSLHILDIIIKGLENGNSTVLPEAYKLKYSILKQMAEEETSFIAYNIYSNGAKEVKSEIRQLTTE